MIHDLWLLPYYTGEVCLLIHLLFVTVLKEHTSVSVLQPGHYKFSAFDLFLSWFLFQSCYLQWSKILQQLLSLVLIHQDHNGLLRVRERNCEVRMEALKTSTDVSYPWQALLGHYIVISIIILNGRDFKAVMILFENQWICISLNKCHPGLYNNDHKVWK